MDTIDHGVSKGQTWLSNFHFTSLGLEVGFPGGSAGKESACNAGEPGSIPGLGRSPGEGIGQPHHYSWASLIAQMVKNLPTMWETWVRSLDWEDPPEEGMANHSSILAWRIPIDRGAQWATVHGVTKSRTWLSDWAEGLQWEWAATRLTGFLVPWPVPWQWKHRILTTGPPGNSLNYVLIKPFKKTKHKSLGF